MSVCVQRMKFRFNLFSKEFKLKIYPAATTRQLITALFKISQCHYRLLFLRGQGSARISKYTILYCRAPVTSCPAFPNVSDVY